MPKKRDKGRVRVSELTVIHPGWTHRYIHIDDDGDVYVADARHGASDVSKVMIAKQMLPAMIRALKTTL